MPSFGDTPEAIWGGWRAAVRELGPLGWRHPYGYDACQGLEFFFGPYGDLRVSVRAHGVLPGYRPATESEIRALDEAVRQGHVQIYLRGTASPYADRSADRRVLHQATGFPPGRGIS